MASLATTGNVYGTTAKEYLRDIGTNPTCYTKLVGINTNEKPRKIA